MKICEFLAEVLINGKIVKRLVVADDETLQTRCAILKETGKRKLILRKDYEAFEKWYRKSPPNSHDRKPKGFGFSPQKKMKTQPSIISAGLPTLGKKR